jgi:hypothetical protein
LTPFAGEGMTFVSSVVVISSLGQAAADSMLGCARGGGEDFGAYLAFSRAPQLDPTPRR